MATGSRTKHWVKLWVSWLTTPAHLELSGGALGLGPLLILLATWDGDYESGGWLLAEDGTPMSRDAIARATHRDRGQLAAQIEELVKCRTLAVREDGAVGFVKYGRWQESRNARYNRASRSASATAHADAHADAHGGQQRGRQTTDDRRQTTEQTTPPTPASGGRRSKSPTDPRVLAVLERVDEHRRRLGLPELTPSARTPTTIAARLKAGATVDELLAVVDAFGRLADREPDKRTVLCATTPFTGPSGSRPGGWAWGLRLLDEERGAPLPRGGASGRIGPALRTVDEVLADRVTS